MFYIDYAFVVVYNGVKKKRPGGRDGCHRLHLQPCTTSYTVSPLRFLYFNAGLGRCQEPFPCVERFFSYSLDLSAICRKTGQVRRCHCNKSAGGFLFWASSVVFDPFPRKKRAEVYRRLAVPICYYALLWAVLERINYSRLVLAMALQG